MEAPGLGLTGTGDAIVYISNGKVTLSVQTVSGGAKSVVSEQEIAGTVAQWRSGRRAVWCSPTGRACRPSCGSSRGRGRRATGCGRDPSPACAGCR
ncbi:MAG: hypothetical protein ACYCTE_14715 [Acidimicrobiales bacterium]